MIIIYVADISHLTSSLVCLRVADCTSGKQYLAVLTDFLFLLEVLAKVRLVLELAHPTEPSLEADYTSSEMKRNV